MDPSRTLADYDALMAGLGRRFETGPDRTMFMDTYAAQALDHMARYGTTRKQFAAVAAKNHNYAVNNARAQYRFPMTVDEVLADRLVTDPPSHGRCARRSVTAPLRSSSHPGTCSGGSPPPCGDARYASRHPH
ncbi:hypothetical protein ACFOJ6_14550 [Gordonia humi]|uniref:hypothetical protein n=1 Tax=Gordonia humi TaxID=686429 RepID=UPI00360C56A2